MAHLVSKASNEIQATTHDLIDDQYMPLFLEKTFANEEKNKKSFDGFSDFDMMYYFINQQKDIDRNRDKNEQTKREYARELLMFYEHLQNYEYSLQLTYSESKNDLSILRTLRKRHVEYYHRVYLATAPLGRGGLPYKKATLQKKTSIIRSFFEFLYQKEYIEVPLHESFYKVSLKEEDAPNRDLYYHEVKQLLEYYEDHVIHYTILLLLATTGMRARELCEAKWRNVTLENGQYWLKIIGKGQKERDILLFPYVYESLLAFRKRRRLPTTLDPLCDTPLIVTFNNKAYSAKYMSNFVTHIIERTRFDFLYSNGRNGKITAHYFRHFFAIYSLEQGANIQYISRSLGHSNLSTTQIYLERHLKKQNHAANAWNNKEAF